VSIGRVRLSRLIGGFLGGIVLLSAVFALLIRLSDLKGGHAAWIDWLVSIRALLGIQELPVKDGNLVQEVLSTVAAAIGAMLPAVVIGIVLIRLFAISFLEWRQTFSHFSAGDLTLKRVQNVNEGVIGIRMYKRISNINLLDVLVEVHLRFFETSPVDGTPYLRRRPIRILDQDGEPTGQRRWPVVSTALPLTLYMLTGELYTPSRPAKLQGQSLEETDGPYVLYVTVAGKMDGLGISVTEAYEYDLRKHCQIGRPTPIDFDPAVKDESAWRGWHRFEEPASVGIFLYDDLMDEEHLGTIAGRALKRDEDYTVVEVRDWVVTWTAITGAADGKTLLAPNLEYQPGAIAKGVLLAASRDEIEKFVAKRPDGIRRIVTNRIAGNSRVTTPDIVWAMVAAPEPGREVYNGTAAAISIALVNRIAKAVRAYDTDIGKALKAERAEVELIDTGDGSTAKLPHQGLQDGSGGVDADGTAQTSQSR
jgi:hypothetical protein